MNSKRIIDGLRMTALFTGLSMATPAIAAPAERFSALSETTALSLSSSVCDPVPNPADGSVPVAICVQVPGPSTVTWSVLTTAFRKIRDGSPMSVASAATIQWDLKDGSGVQVANGLYYIRVDITGPQPLTRILKVMVLR